MLPKGGLRTVTLPNLLEQAREAGANSVLYVYIHFKGMDNMRVGVLLLRRKEALAREGGHFTRSVAFRKD